MPRFIRIWIFSALLSFTAVGMWKGLEWYYYKDDTIETEIVMSALDLTLSYEQDADFSNSLYNGKTILLSGVVKNIEDNGNQYILSLNGNVFHIELIFNDVDEIEKLKNISVGETITIKGLIDGMNSSTIQIIDCFLE